MTTLPPCPICTSVYTYEDQSLYICPECAHEWRPDSPETAKGEEDGDFIVHDANGTVLKDGDTVTLIKDLKLKGSSDIIKIGTKVKNIRLVNSDHNIDCKVPGIGPMALKSEFVKKVTE